ncbi:unknown [Phocaeicola coprocola CAG:162]|uniref:Uncharacterized protein n=1 Tax=Phocaeicola coprocola CAG:162 TaxID=1263040 RepID=R6CHV1_9BACT|nr:unknown [Phocaeicola coprocola CAG:162]
MILQFLYQLRTCFLLVILCQYNRSFYYLTANFIGYTCYGTLYYCRMGHQSAFYFERADTITGTLDYIIRTAYEPVITIFVTPCDVTGIINSVVPCFASQFCITIILFKQSQRFSLIGTYNDLSLFTIFGRTSVGCKQVDIVLRIRNTHTAWFRIHPWESSKCKSCFCLSETFHQADTCDFLECFVNRVIQCFSRRSTIFQ